MYQGNEDPVSLVVSLVAEGATVEEIIKDYPSLTPEDIKAEIKYASRLCDYEAYPI